MPGTKSSERPSSCNKVTDAHAHQTTCSSPATPDHTLPQRSRRSGTIPKRWPRMPHWTSARLFPPVQNRIHILLYSATSLSAFCYSAPSFFSFPYCTPFLTFFILSSPFHPSSPSACDKGMKRRRPLKR